MMIYFFITITNQYKIILDGVENIKSYKIYSEMNSLYCQWYFVILIVQLYLLLSQNFPTAAALHCYFNTILSTNEVLQ